MSDVRVAFDTSDHKPIKVWLQDCEGNREHGAAELSIRDALQLMLNVGRAIDAVAHRDRGIA